MLIIQLVVLLAFLLGVVVVLQAYTDAQTYQTSTAAELTGMCTSALDRTARRNQNLNTIRRLLQERDTAANREVRDQLGVSSRTVVRYMNELITRGEVEQVGVTGVDVTYRLR